MISICPGIFTESLWELGTVGAFPLIPLGACEWLCRKIPASLQGWNGLWCQRSQRKHTPWPVSWLWHSSTSVFKELMSCFCQCSKPFSSQQRDDLPWDFSISPGLSLAQAFLVVDFYSKPHCVSIGQDIVDSEAPSTGMRERVEIELGSSMACSELHHPEWSPH